MLSKWIISANLMHMAMAGGNRLLLFQETCVMWLLKNDFEHFSSAFDVKYSEFTMEAIKKTYKVDTKESCLFMKNKWFCFYGLS